MRVIKENKAMRFVKKASLSLLLILTLALTLVGCEGIFAPPAGPGGGGGDNPPAEEAVYRIVYSDKNIDMLELRSVLIEIQGTVVTVGADTEPEKHEFVLGDTNRAVTASAKAELAKLIEADSSSDCGYIIYSDGNSVAAYWSASFLESFAMEALIDECIKNKEVEIPTGVIYSSLHDSREAQWDAIEEKYGADMARALKNLHQYYQGEKIALWIANLYDSEIGGFYYSRSARDYAGFLPDLESTSQAFSILSFVGAIPTDKRAEMLTDEIKDKIADFVRNMQSSEDGYFYHPQWPYGKENLNTDRYGRDQGSATSILEKISYDEDGDGVVDPKYPKYCTVDGTKCALHAGSETESCTFPVKVNAVSSCVSSKNAITRPLSSGVSAAISCVSNSTVRPVASSHPVYTSEKAFLNWLEEYNAEIHQNSGGAHNLAALTDEIMAHGYEDVLIDHLNERQKALFDEQTSLGETPTGTWQRPIDYKNVWGTYKYMCIYNTVGSPINLEYAPYMIRTCLAVVALPAIGNYAYNDLMNQWTAITSLISNVKEFYGVYEAMKLYEIVREDPVGLVENSLQKMLPFRQEDGSFSNKVNGTTSANIYGVPIALGGVAEGNVNSTHILLNMYSSICSALNCPRVALCDESVGIEVVNTMANGEPIDKIELKKAIYDFESIDVPDSITLSKSNADAEMTIVADPTDDDNSVLYFKSPTSGSGGDTLNVNASGTGGNGYVFNADMYVTSSSSNGTILQLRFSDTYMLQIKKNSDGTLIIQEASSINGHNVVDIATVKTDEWFNLAIEYYANGGSNELDVPVIKIWVNEEYVTSSTNYFGSHNTGAAPKTTCKALNMLSLRRPETYVYLDNLQLDRESLEYDAESNIYPFE